MLVCQCGQSFRQWTYPVHCSCGRTITSGGEQQPPRKLDACIHRGLETGSIECRTCGDGRRQATTYLCAVHGECVLSRPVTPAGRPRWQGGICVTCPDYVDGAGDGA